MRNIPGGTEQLLSSCQYFTVHRVTVDGRVTLPITQETFRSVVMTEGEGILTLGETVLALRKGDSVFLPAQDAEYTVSGRGELIVSRV